MPFYVCSLPNIKKAGRIPELVTDDPAAIAAFAKKWDVAGRGVFQCVGYLKPGATRRCHENVGVIDFVFSDIDFRALTETPDEIAQKLRALPLVPTWVRQSGGGFHMGYQLKEPAEAGDTDYFERVCTAIKQLAMRLSADPMPTNPASLLRMPGTHNSKWGEPVLVEQLWGSGQAVDLSEIETLVELLPETGLFTPKPVASNGHDRAEGEPRTAGEHKAAAPPRLEDIAFGNIHNTWKYWIGSELRNGTPADDVYHRLLQAAEQSPACQADPARKLWPRSLADLMTWYLRTESDFVLNLASEGQDRWHSLIRNKEKPMLVWQPDLGQFGQLQVRRIRGARLDADSGTAENAGNADNAANDRPHHGEENKAASDQKQPPWPTPYSGRGAAQIPLRSFAMGQHYIIGACSITASAGGVGKSTLSLLDGISFVVARNLLTGEILEKRRRVWVWNAEDDVDEMERRVVGICAHYNINRADLVGWLFLDSGYDLPLELAHGNSKGPVMQEELISLIAARVKRQGIEVVMLDPLVALHSMSEGDNPGHAKLIRTLSTKVAKPCNCAVDINAHTRKSGAGQEVLTVDDIRGAGAIVYSARSGRILHTMSLAEAEKYCIDAEERLAYYRLERAKANMAKRGTICWVHMFEVPIPNRPDGSYGDTIAVPVIWTPPNAMEGVTDTIADAIASEIAKGEYKRDARAAASWAGRLVGLRCGIDTGTKSGKDRARVILETLIKKGVLAVEIRTDKNRNAREYVVPGVLFKGGRGPA